jgi:maltose alpha-D-glucosyltransferase/alpha-amylase
VSNQGDAWGFTLDYLKRFFEKADLLPADELGEAGERHADYLARLNILGQRTAELHMALARPTDDPAFAPEPMQESDLSALRDNLDHWIDNALAALAKAEAGLSEGDREQVQQVLSREAELRKIAAKLVPRRADAMRTRCHGDLHLGQVIVIENDFLFTDFEGEPARSIDERRQKQSPLRDVAGMLRSFDYSAAVALRERAATRPESRELLEQMAQDWRQQAKARFMASYEENIDGRPPHPADPRDAQALTEIFVLEKALYEICYEAANRPDWIRIPLDGVIEFLEHKW